MQNEPRLVWCPLSSQCQAAFSPLRLPSTASCALSIFLSTRQTDWSPAWMDLFLFFILAVTLPICPPPLPLPPSPVPHVCGLKQQIPVLTCTRGLLAIVDQEWKSRCCTGSIQYTFLPGFSSPIRCIFECPSSNGKWQFNCLAFLNLFSATQLTARDKAGSSASCHDPLPLALCIRRFRWSHEAANSMSDKSVENHCWGPELPWGERRQVCAGTGKLTGLLASRLHHSFIVPCPFCHLQWIPAWLFTVIWNILSLWKRGTLDIQHHNRWWYWSHLTEQNSWLRPQKGCI